MTCNLIFKGVFHDVQPVFRNAPTLPPATIPLLTRARTCLPGVPPEYATSATTSRTKNRDTFHASTNAASSEDAPPRATTTRIHFPRGNRPLSIRSQRHLPAPTALSNVLVDSASLSRPLAETRN